MLKELNVIYLLPYFPLLYQLNPIYFSKTLHIKMFLCVFYNDWIRRNNVFECRITLLNERGITFGRSCEDEKGDESGGGCCRFRESKINDYKILES